MPYTDALLKLREMTLNSDRGAPLITPRSRIKGLADKYTPDSSKNTGFMSGFNATLETSGQDSIGNIMYGDLMKERNAIVEAQSKSQAGTNPVSKPTLPKNIDKKRLSKGIREAAKTLGVKALDLATIISYETGGTFDPLQDGPTTQWGHHKGLIQFGEPQARQFGVNWDDPYGSQLGSEGAIVKYFRGSGLKKGMGLLDMYSTVNAGRPGLYNATDMGTSVRQKVEAMRGGHRAKARLLLG